MLFFQVRWELIIFVLILVLLISTISITSGRECFTVIEDVFFSTVMPVQEFFTYIGLHVRSLEESIVKYRDLEREVASLERELEKKDGLYNELIEVKQENERLREMLNFKKYSDYNYLPARVIARDPSQWFELIVIDKGYNDGVKGNMPVVTNKGLAGIVFAVSRNSSQVLLLTDSRCAVGALVQRSRDPGLIGVVESYPENQEYLKMINIPAEAYMKPGDVIISSGLGGYFPKGLVIGEVVELRNERYNVLQYAIIKPAVNFNRLEEVFVLQNDFFLEEEAGASDK